MDSQFKQSPAHGKRNTMVHFHTTKRCQEMLWPMKTQWNYCEWDYFVYFCLCYILTFEMPCKLCISRQDMRLCLKVNKRQQKCHMYCLGRTRWRPKKYITTEVFEARQSAASVVSSDTRHQAVWALGRRGTQTAPGREVEKNLNV